MCILNNLIGHVQVTCREYQCNFGWILCSFVIQKSTNKDNSAAIQYLEGMSVVAFVTALRSQQILLKFFPEEMPSIDNIQFMTLAIASAFVSCNLAGTVYPLQITVVSD